MPKLSHFILLNLFLALSACGKNGKIVTSLGSSEKQKVTISGVNANDERQLTPTLFREKCAERKGRSGSVVDADADRYARFSAAAEAAIDPRAPSGGWSRRRAEGKALSVVRLAKASATYAGGADYIVWKINRHAGTDFVLKPWQRRHPLLGAISLLPRLLRSGAIR